MKCFLFVVRISCLVNSEIKLEKKHIAKIQKTMLLKL